MDYHKIIVLALATSGAVGTVGIVVLSVLDLPIPPVLASITAGIIGGMIGALPPFRVLYPGPIDETGQPLPKK